MKGESVHAIFAQIEQQRAKQDQRGLQGDDVKQPGPYFGHHADHECRNAAVTKKYEEHPRSFPCNRSLQSDALAGRRVVPLSRNPWRAPVRTTMPRAKIVAIPA